MGRLCIDKVVFDMLNVEQVMKHAPQTVSPNSSIDEVAETLTTKEFHAFPVVEGDQLVGIVTTTDIIKFLLDKYRSN